MVTPPDTRLLYKSIDGHARSLTTYDWLIKFITVPYTSTWVETSVGVTHVICAGREDAPIIVLLHGQGASAPTWNGQINELAQHYRIFAPDVPASMGKSTPTRLPRSGMKAGEWLKATLDGLGVTTAHLVGISNGAWLILKLATVAPEKMKSATLLSAAGIVPTSLRLMTKAIPFLTVGPFVSPARKTQMFGRMLGVPGKPMNEQDQAMFTVLLGDFKMEPTPGPLPENELHCLTAPTQLLIGEHEAAFPAPNVINRAKAVLPNLVRAEVLAGVGHGMITEDVSLVSNRISAFVQMIENKS